MNNPIVKGRYQTADNPIFEVFYLENPHRCIADFSGNPPFKTFLIFLDYPNIYYKNQNILDCKKSTS